MRTDRYSPEARAKRGERHAEAVLILAALRRAGMEDIEIAFKSGNSWRAIYKWRTGLTVPHPEGLERLRRLAAGRGIEVPA